MLKLHSFVKAGDSTACAPLKFTSKMKERLPIFQHFKSDELFQNHIRNVIECFDRWEYVVLNEDGETLAMMVIIIDPYDPYKGEPVISNLYAGSLQDGLLTGAYRLMLSLARERGINWACFTRTDGQKSPNEYKHL